MTREEIANTISANYIEGIDSDSPAVFSRVVEHMLSLLEKNEYTAQKIMLHVDEFRTRALDEVCMKCFETDFEKHMKIYLEKASR